MLPEETNRVMSRGSVLVTGARGFVGSHVVNQLLEDGWTVYSTVRHDPQGDFDVQMDFDDQRFVIRFDDLPRIDAVVHLAATVDFRLNAVSGLFQTNIVATASLAEFARRRNARLIFASSALVAGTKTQRIEPCSMPNADSPYTRSKLVAEELISLSGVSAAILRIGGVFGLDGPSHLGLNRAIQSVLDGNPPELSGSGKALRNYIYVKDVAHAIAEVLRKNISGTHLLAGSDVRSVGEMLELLCDIFLPGTRPICREGGAGFDQVIDPSTQLPKSRAFSVALEDIRSDSLL